MSAPGGLWAFTSQNASIQCYPPLVEKFKEEASMKNRLGSFIFCSILVFFCASGLSETKQFIVFFDFPLAGVTVGRYFTSDGHQHGFVLNNSAFTSVDVGSISTDAA